MCSYLIRYNDQLRNVNWTLKLKVEAGVQNRNKQVLLHNQVLNDPPLVRAKFPQRKLLIVILLEVKVLNNLKLGSSQNHKWYESRFSFTDDEITYHCYKYLFLKIFRRKGENFDQYSCIIIYNTPPLKNRNTETFSLKLATCQSRQDIVWFLSTSFMLIVLHI